MALTALSPYLDSSGRTAEASALRAGLLTFASFGIRLGLLVLVGVGILGGDRGGDCDAGLFSPLSPGVFSLN